MLASKKYVNNEIDQLKQDFKTLRDIVYNMNYLIMNIARHCDLIYCAEKKIDAHFEKIDKNTCQESSNSM